MCPLGVFRLRTTRVRGPGPSPCSPLLSLGLFLASLYSEIIFPPLPPPPPPPRLMQGIRKTVFHKELRPSSPQDPESKAISCWRDTPGDRGRGRAHLWSRRSWGHKEAGSPSLVSLLLLLLFVLFYSCPY